MLMVVDDRRKASRKAAMELHRKALLFRRKGQSAGAYERFVRTHCVTMVSDLGEKKFKHLIALVWK